MVAKLIRKYDGNAEISAALPSSHLIEAACFAHDLGHPPFGHGGEKALHKRMWKCGGFEGNGQTLRILSKLEKYKVRRHGINPTRRFVLAVLKYGVPYSKYPSEVIESGPPKCYFDSEASHVTDALSAFSVEDRERYLSMSRTDNKPSPQYMTLDASIMEMADDIAYAVHDLEDIVARRFVKKDQIAEIIRASMEVAREAIESIDSDLSADQVVNLLFSDWSGDRKQGISRLVNIFINSVEIEKNETFAHPLLSLRAAHPKQLNGFLKALKDATYKLVVNDAGVQQLEVRGKRIVVAIFDEFIREPEKLIPKGSWNDLDERDPIARRVADYVAGMTDAFAQRIYQRLFTPGYGSSHDEL